MSKRVAGIASAFEKPDAPPPSAVSGLASRFQQPEAAQPAAVSSRIAGVAGRFGESVGAAPVPKKNGALGKGKVAPPPVEKAPEPEEEVDSKARYADAAKLFASGAAAKKEEKSEDKSMFSAAALAFKTREEDERKPAESKVSAFAKTFGKAADSSVADSTRSVDTGGAPTVASANARVSEIARDIETSAKKGGGPVAAKAGKADEGESLPGRFTQATKLFEGIKEPEKDVDESGESLKSRFADASKLFGGN